MGTGKEIKYLVQKKLMEIQNTGNEGLQKALLAQLRKGAGKQPGELPELLGAILKDVPEHMFGYGLDPSKEEWAIYIAMTLYAVHQQGKDPRLNPMFNQMKFGNAMAQLATNDENEIQKVIRRFNTVATSLEITEVAHHLRTSVQLLRDKGIGLDFASLAEDLYYYQFEDYKADVRLRWGRDFYNMINKIQNSEEK